MLILIIIVFLALFISANCSLYEAVLYSSRMGTLEAARTTSQHQKAAEKLIAMKHNISEPIAAILILNTLANTGGATLAGSYANNVLGVGLIPLFSLVFTLGVLFISEILPKTLGAIYWRNFWYVIIYPLILIKYLLYPAIFVTRKFSDLLAKRGPVTTITEEEILALVRLGAREGEITQEESQMVRNIISLENKRVREIMTPRTMMFTLDSNLTFGKALKLIQGRGFSRIPLYEEHKERIIGYVMAQDIYASMAANESGTLLKSKAHPISFVPGTANCLRLLLKFLKSRLHLAIVLDEYGGVDGLITLEDLIETVLGTEIVDETDLFVDLQVEARKRRKEGEEK